MSFKLAAPSLFKFSQEVIYLGGRGVIPFETGIVLHELIKVSHQFVDCLTHVHVSNGSPDVIGIGKCCCFVFICPNSRLELVTFRRQVSSVRVRKEK